MHITGDSTKLFQRAVNVGIACACGGQDDVIDAAFAGEANEIVDSVPA